MWEAYQYDVYIFVFKYNAAVRMCTVTFDLCVLWFVFHMCLIYFISFFSGSYVRKQRFSTDMRIPCHSRAIEIFCVFALGSCLLESFIFVSIVHSYFPRLTWRKLPKERLAELKPLLLLRFWYVCSLRDTSFSDVSTIRISSVRIMHTTQTKSSSKVD